MSLYPSYLLVSSKRYRQEAPATSLPPGNYARVLHDDEAKDGKQRIGMPEVYPLLKSQVCLMTPDWQRFMYSLFVYSCRGTYDDRQLTKTERGAVVTAFSKVYKTSIAFCNFKGFDGWNNYITGKTGEIKDEPPATEPLICCGNIVKVLDRPQKRVGEHYYTAIETLDGNRPPPPIDKVNRQVTPWLVFVATNVAADRQGYADATKWKPIILSDGRYRVDPFPQLGGRDVCVPLRTNGRDAETYQRDGVSYAVNYIRASRLEAVTGLVRAYVP